MVTEQLDREVHPAPPPEQVPSVLAAGFGAG
jgi:hypothetical protein